MRLLLLAILLLRPCAAWAGPPPSDPDAQEEITEDPEPESEDESPEPPAPKKGPSLGVEASGSRRYAELGVHFGVPLDLGGVNAIEGWFSNAQGRDEEAEPLVLSWEAGCKLLRDDEHPISGELGLRGLGDSQGRNGVGLLTNLLSAFDLAEGTQIAVGVGLELTRFTAPADPDNGVEASTAWQGHLSEKLQFSFFEGNAVVWGGLGRYFYNGLAEPATNPVLLDEIPEPGNAMLFGFYDRDWTLGASVQVGPRLSVEYHEILTREIEPAWIKRVSAELEQGFGRLSAALSASKDIVHGAADPSFGVSLGWNF